MPFAPETLDRVMDLLRLPVIRAYVETVQGALDHAAFYGGDLAIARIEAEIANYYTQKAASLAAISNAGLIQAGPLKWALGSRNAGYEKETKASRVAIATSLHLTHLIKPTGKVRLIR